MNTTDNHHPATAAGDTIVPVSEFKKFEEAVLQGLTRSPKTLPTQYLYDERGSALFDQICELPEYYPTRTELGIMARHAGEMASAIGPEVVLIEYGSGSSLKTRSLLNNLKYPKAYVPVDISGEHLLASCKRLSREFPGLRVIPVCGDFTGALTLPNAVPTGRRVVYFPGSTIGNFEPTAAVELLLHMKALAGRGGKLLVGADLTKDSATLEAAYDDSAGVTAQFNLNLLDRINRELHADFDVSRFRHRARYESSTRRIALELVSVGAQDVRIAGYRFHFDDGESVRTEYSHKYRVEDFGALAKEAGLRVARTWIDDKRWFSVHLLSSSASDCSA